MDNTNTKSALRTNPEIVKWANNYFEDNRAVLKLFDINSPNELIDRLLSIPNAKEARERE